MPCLRWWSESIDVGMARCVAGAPARGRAFPADLYLKRITRMSSSTKIVSVQSYQMILYRRALHPEFFALKGRRGMQGC